MTLAREQRGEASMNPVQSITSERRKESGEFFRDYLGEASGSRSEGSSAVRDFYRQNHTQQTLDFVRADMARERPFYEDLVAEFLPDKLRWQEAPVARSRHSAPLRRRHRDVLCTASYPRPHGLDSHGHPAR